MRLLRTMKRRGICEEFRFYRYVADQYGEGRIREEGVVTEGYFSELLHRDNPYISRQTSEVGVADKGCTPMMVIPYEENPGIFPGDFAEVGKAVYEVLHVREVAGVYCLVSLRRAAKRLSEDVEENI